MPFYLPGQPRLFPTVRRDREAGGFPAVLTDLFLLNYTEEGKKMSKEIEKLQEIIDQHDNIVFFGGAGVSTESGIPDFRSQDGLYHQQYKYPPEEEQSALETVIHQCEQWADVDTSDYNMYE